MKRTTIFLLLLLTSLMTATAVLVFTTPEKPRMKIEMIPLKKMKIHR